jgi:beta-glucanase (GH16 family)
VNKLSKIILFSVVWVVLAMGCNDPSAPSPIPSPNPNAKKWRLEFVDEFKGLGSAYGNSYPYLGQDQNCYGQQLLCKDPTSGKQVACSSQGESLAALNKCLWSVGHGLNYMNSADDRHNRFDVDQVEVNTHLDNGVLILRGVLTGESDSNCKPNTLPEQLSCRYKSGYVDSGSVSGFSKAHGITRAGGLIQIRSKLAIGSGSWPGLWMLGEGSWPQHGEIDILEADKDAVKSWQTLHTAACYIPSDLSHPFQYLDWAECGQKGGTQWHLGKGDYVNSTDKRLDSPSKTLAESYHTYTAVWNPGVQLKFFTDNVNTHTVNTGDKHDATSQQDAHAASMKIPVQVPTVDKQMVFILNQSIAWADQNQFKPQALYVDYVKAWSPCSDRDTEQSDCTYCVSGGVESAGYCKVATLSLDSNVDYWVDANPQWPGVYYKKSKAGCNHGGTSQGPNCQVYSFSSGEVETNIRYWVDSRPGRQGVYYLPISY